MLLYCNFQKMENVFVLPTPMSIKVLIKVKFYGIFHSRGEGVTPSQNVRVIFILDHACKIMFHYPNKSEDFIALFSWISLRPIKCSNLANICAIFHINRSEFRGPRSPCLCREYRNWLKSEVVVFVKESFNTFYFYHHTFILFFFFFILFI